MPDLDHKIIERAGATDFWLGVVAEASRRIVAVGRTLARRKAVFDLGRLDDRALSDMGLTRSDLAEGSRWSLWGEPAGRLTELSNGRRAPRLG